VEGVSQISVEVRALLVKPFQGFEDPMNELVGQTFVGKCSYQSSSLKKFLQEWFQVRALSNNN